MKDTVDVNLKLISDSQVYVICSLTIRNKLNNLKRRRMNDCL
ncbi:hypothetical protein DDI_4531 [Dickeya dianthicola RNS04.9]|nr:hypothetical protein DDI_4218 [Dickeya dianthicola RNS04.9]ATO35699.1 hypothetical protein DDI_4531 [Dickeya dianthicola RNS04.9]